MKYCPKCGAEMADDARFCPKCGAEYIVQNANTEMVTGQVQTQSDTLKTAAKVFMVIGTVVLGLCTWIALAWCLPMTITYFDKVKKGEPVGTGFKVCCLLFVSLIAGIIMLCDNDNK